MSEKEKYTSPFKPHNKELPKKNVVGLVPPKAPPEVILKPKKKRLPKIEKNKRGNNI